MKALLRLGLLAAAVSFGGVAGKWSGTMSVSAPDWPGAEVDVIVVFEESGSELGGTFTPEGKQAAEITSGSVKGERVVFEVQGVNPSMKFDGTLAGDSLKCAVEGVVRVGDEEHPFHGKLNLKREP